MKNALRKSIIFSSLIVIIALSVGICFSFFNHSSNNDVSSSIGSEASSDNSSSSTSSTSSPTLEEKPIITNIDDISIMQGVFFSPLKDIKGFSVQGEDITPKIKVSGNIDYGTPGIYEIKYTLEDEGKVTSKTRKVTVIKDDQYGKKEEPYIYESDTAYVISTGAKAYGTYRDNNSPSFLVDGDSATRYESPWEEDISYVTIDLGASLSFERIVINWENASSKHYTIAVSDDNRSFTDLASFEGSYGARIDDQTINGKGRYVRFFLMDKSYSAYGFSIYEIEIYGKRGLAIPKNMYPDLFDEKVIADEQYLELDFNSTVSATRINTSFYDLGPSSYRISLFSNNAYHEVYLGNGSNVNFALSSFTKVRYEFISRPLKSYCYRVSEIKIYNNDDEVSLDGCVFSASSFKEEHRPELAKNNYGNFWASDYRDEQQDSLIIDLGSVKDVGEIDLLFETNYGKIYDIEVSEDGIKYTLRYRELHGATALQNVSLSCNTRFIKITEYSKNSMYRHRLESIVVHSINPLTKPYSFNIKDLPTISTTTLGKGSYAKDDIYFPTARYIAYDDRQKDGAVPSNGIYQSLLINNFGHAMYLYPLRVKYTSNGLGISYPGEGYFETTYNRSQTVTNTIDLTLFPNCELQETSTALIDDSDMTFGVSFSDTTADKMVNYFSQGSPFISSFFADKKAKITFKDDAIVSDGTRIINNGESVETLYAVISLSSLTGYKNNNGVQQEVYEDRQYLISTSKMATFTREEGGLSIDLQNNYLSICPLESGSDIESYYRSSLDAILRSTVNYKVDDTSKVTTTYYYHDYFQSDLHQESKVVMLPHQRKRATTLYSDIFYKSVRGDLHVVEGSSFVTTDQFYGIAAIPDEPFDTTYSKDIMRQYLEKLLRDTQNNLLGEDAYWQGKSLHPLANGILIADNLGYIDLRNQYLERLKNILSDWYTYSGPNDRYYFYYDNEWGTLYYRASEFGANTAIADHHFTYGYFAFATMVCFSFDETFKQDYQPMADFLILDYLNYTDDTSTFCDFRNFDYYAGHSWAGGYADSDGGNNQESASEALNSYQAAYLYSQVTDNQEMQDAAIYCYVTELSSIKQYWFNYDEDSYSDDYPYHGVGQIYGGSNFYGTFFNGDPTYIYGIHLLPGGEYLSSYALGETEKEKLASLYEDYIKEEENWTGHQAEDGYQHIYWVILALFDPDSALKRLQTRLDEIQNSTELFNVYYLIHAFKSLGTRSKEIYSSGLPSSTYTKDGETVSIINNLSSTIKDVTFYKDGNAISTISVAPHTICRVDPYKSVAIHERLDAESTISFTEAQTSQNDNGMISYSFCLYFKENTTYHLALNVINPTDENLYIKLFDDKGSLIDILEIPKDDNVNVKGAALHFYGKHNLKIEVSQALIVNNFTFVRI